MNNEVVNVHRDITPGSCLTINREWENNDKITIEFEMKGKLHMMGDLPEFVAITRGPIVLSRDERLGNPAMEAVLTPLTNESGYIELNYEKSLDSEIWMLFSANFIPESYAEQGAGAVEVQLCDYASAGNTTNSFPFFKVWLPQLFNPRN